MHRDDRQARRVSDGEPRFESRADRFRPRARCARSAPRCGSRSTTTGARRISSRPLGPRGPGGLVLSGHTDVVPVEGQAWDTDPFALVEKDGRLYGRGTSDMKSFIAIALALLPDFVPRLKRPLHLALSYDEEVGCIGVGRLIDDLARADVQPSGCIVGEPTLMTPVIAHKGKRSYRCSVRGLAAHSAYAPQAVNAVEAAAEAVAYLKGMARRLQRRGPLRPRLRRRAHDGAHRRHRAAARRSTSCRTSARSISNSGTCPATIPDALLDELKSPHRARASSPRCTRSTPRPVSRSCRCPRSRRSTRAPRRRSWRSCTSSPARRDVGQGLLRHRGLAVPARGHPVGRVRPRLDRAGAQAERVHRARAGGGVREVPAAASWSA